MANGWGLPLRGMRKIKVSISYSHLSSPFMGQPAQVELWGWLTVAESSLTSLESSWPLVDWWPSSEAGSGIHHSRIKFQWVIATEAAMGALVTMRLWFSDWLSCLSSKFKHIRVWWGCVCVWTYAGFLSDIIFKNLFEMALYSNADSFEFHFGVDDNFK